MWDKIKTIIQSHQRFVVTTHQSPEGDAIGSAVAVKEFLRTLGKDVIMVNYDPVPPMYLFLDEFKGEWVHKPEEIKEKVHGAEVIFIVDVGGDNQMGPLAKIIKDSDIIKIRIDHHRTNDVLADVSVVDANASATGELIYSLVKSMHGTINKKMADSIYLAIATDTGWFRFTNTNTRVFAICTELMELGVDVSSIYEKIYQSKPWSYLEFLKLVLNSMHMECDGRLAWFVLTNDMLKSSQIKHVDTEPLFDLVRGVEVVEVVVLFREQSQKKVKVGFRSKHKVDVCKLAEQFGGGGHVRASGATVTGTMDEVVNGVIDATRQAVTTH